MAKLLFTLWLDRKVFNMGFLFLKVLVCLILLLVLFMIRIVCI